MLRSTLLAVVLGFAPCATSKVNKLLVLSQLGFVGEWRDKLDDDFFYLSEHQARRGFPLEQNNSYFTFVTCPWCYLAKRIYSAAALNGTWNWIFFFFSPQLINVS